MHQFFDSVHHFAIDDRLFTPAKMGRRRIPPMQVAEESIRKGEQAPSSLEVHHFGLKGRGIITRKEYQDGDYIVYYHGDVVDAVPEGADDSYFFEIAAGKQTVWIDGTAEDGSFGRLINDSNKDPNARPKKILVDGKPYVAFFATRSIDIGEEVAYNYGPSPHYWWRYRKDGPEKIQDNSLMENNARKLSDEGSISETNDKQSESTTSMKQSEPVTMNKDEVNETENLMGSDLPLKSNEDEQYSENITPGNQSELVTNDQDQVNEMEDFMGSDLPVKSHEDEQYSEKITPGNQSELVTNDHDQVNEMEDFMGSDLPVKSHEDEQYSENITPGNQSELVTNDHDQVNEMEDFMGSDLPVKSHEDEQYSEKITPGNQSELVTNDHDQVNEMEDFMGSDLPVKSHEDEQYSENITPGNQSEPTKVEHVELKETEDFMGSDLPVSSDEDERYSELDDDDRDPDYKPDESGSDENLDGKQNGTGDIYSIFDIDTVDEIMSETITLNKESVPKTVTQQKKKCDDHHSSATKICKKTATVEEDYYQNIEIQTTANRGQRCFDKRYYCLFCEKPQAKLPRHLLLKHKDEPQVIAYDIETDPKMKSMKLAKLRNLGNHKQNCQVLRDGKGTLIVGYRPNRPVNPAQYGPCEYCFVYLVRTDLWKHRCTAKDEATQNAASTSGKRKRPSITCKLLLPPPRNISSQVHMLLQLMLDDDIGRIVRGDSLILDLAQREYLKHGHDPDQHSVIRGTLRRMGRLLLQLRSNTKRCRDLISYIDPAYFREVVLASKMVAGFDETTHMYATPSLALKIGHSLKKCAKIIEGKSIEEGDEEIEKRAKKFHQLCEMNWTEAVSSHALRTLYENKRNNIKLLPFTEDIMTFSRYLKDQTRKQMEELQDGPSDLTAAWQSLCKIILARIILFNRRRSGEASKMTLDDYKHRPSPDGQKVVLDGLSNIEQELCRSLFRIEIRGKRGNTVPVLLTKDMADSIDLLIKKRKEVGVHDENKFLFPRANYGSHGHIRGCDCLRELSQKSGTKQPTLLRSRGLRKQIATISQIVNLKDNELDILAKFLGHDIRVHREYYRLPEETLQVAKVSKLLLASEQGQVLHGKSLNDINVTVDEELDEKIPDEDISDDEEEVEEEKQDQTRDQGSNVNRGNSVEEEEHAENARKKQKKRPWSYEEKAAVLRHLARFLAMKKLPGKNAIDECIRKECTLANRSWKNVKDFCRNRILSKDPLQI